MTDDTLEAPELDPVEIEDAPDELVIQIGDEPIPDEQEAGTRLVKHLRDRTSEQAKEIARLRARQQPVPVIEVGPKPTAESCGWDDDALSAAMETWVGQKAKAEEAKAAQRKAAEAVENAITEDRARYLEKKARVAAPDYQDAEDAVQAALGDASGVIMRVANDPTLVVRALHSHPAKLAELVKLTADPVKLIAAVVRLEGNIKMTTRKPPEPEKIARGTAPASVAQPDKALARLEAEAERTGDRSKVAEYRRKQRER